MNHWECIVRECYDMMAKLRELRNRCGLMLGLFTLLFFAAIYSHQEWFKAPTPVSRLNLMHSMVNGTFHIDAYHENTGDKAVFEGRFYSDKAPGTVALAFPSFAAAAGILKAANVPLNTHLGWLTTSWVASAMSNGLLMAIGGVALFAWLRYYIESTWALITTLAIFLGAAPLPYATMMFSHTLVVGLLALAIWAIQKGTTEITKEVRGVERRVASSDRDSPDVQSSLIVTTATNGRRTESSLDARRGSPGKVQYDMLAGFACGWAVASEFTAGIVIMGLFAWLVSMEWRRAIPFCLASIPPLLLIPAYSWVCFGNPLVLPYSLQATFPAMQEGLYAIKWPDAETAANLLFHPARGLLFWTPFLVMAGFGYFKLFRISPRLFWLTYGIPLLHIVVISGRVWDWPAGPTLGPRYLAPILPLLALPCAYGLRMLPVVGVPLAVYSLLITSLATLTHACPQFQGHPNPLFDLHIPRLLEGKFSYNLGLSFGLPPHASILVFYAVIGIGIAWLWRQLSKENAR